MAFENNRNNKKIDTCIAWYFIFSFIKIKKKNGYHNDSWIFSGALLLYYSNALILWNWNGSIWRIFIFLSFANSLYDFVTE